MIVFVIVVHLMVSVRHCVAAVIYVILQLVRLYSENLVHLTAILNHVTTISDWSGLKRKKIFCVSRIWNLRLVQNSRMAKNKFSILEIVFKRYFYYQLSIFFNSIRLKNFIERERERLLAWLPQVNSMYLSQQTKIKRSKRVVSHMRNDSLTQDRYRFLLNCMLFIFSFSESPQTWL